MVITSDIKLQLCIIKTNKLEFITTDEVRYNSCLLLQKKIKGRVIKAT